MNKTKIIQEIIVHLKGITDSLEALTQVSETHQVEPEVAEKVAAEKKLKKPTLEELREAMAEKSKAGHREEVKAVLLKYGAKKLTSLDEKHYADVLKEVGEIK